MKVNGSEFLFTAVEQGLMDHPRDPRLDWEWVELRNRRLSALVKTRTELSEFFGSVTEGAAS
jgi:hypothetical protein